MRTAAIFINSVLLSSSAYAISPENFPSFEPGAMSGPATSVISFGYIIQLVFSLLVVLGLIYVAAKYILPKISPSTKGKILEVTDKVILEPQVTSYILKAGKSSWLIVVSNKSIAKIDKLEGNLDSI